MIILTELKRFICDSYFISLQNVNIVFDRKYTQVFSERYKTVYWYIKAVKFNYYNFLCDLNRGGNHNFGKHTPYIVFLDRLQ